MENELNCPTCGAPAQVENRFTKMVKCEYCDSQLLLEGEQFDFKGKAKLAETPSIFSIGQKGIIRGADYRVLGHIRYNWGNGYWDEWFVNLNAEEPAWICDDGGELSMYRRIALEEPAPDYESLSAGDAVEVDDYRFTVGEKGEAEIEGFEGELPFTAKSGDAMKYVDGSGDGLLYSIEYEPEEILFFEGRAVRSEEVEPQG